ncbi:MAG: SPFH domain-containing protein [Candidatus Zixiibacteriota bacterium]|jgi:regulator of protease activity HflC (stomatin/prohibitin superfamily)
MAELTAFGWCLIALASGFGFVVLILLLRSFRIVRQAEVIVVERLGKYHRTMDSGLRILLPIIEKPRHVNWRYRDSVGRSYFRDVYRIPLRETVYDFLPQNVITRDNVITEINGLLYFQITDPMRAVYEIEDLPLAIEKLTQTSLRNICGEMDLDEMLTSRDVINTKLKAILDEASDKWGVKVNRVEIQDIRPPDDILEAMEKQMRAERERRAVVLDAEGAKQSAILRAEGEREANIRRAEGTKEAAILEAEGEAQARMKVADAEAKALNMVGKALAEVSDPAQYLVAVRYIDTLKEITSGQGNKLVFMPYEAQGLISTVGSLKALFEEGGGPSAPAGKGKAKS